jgi:hypothetical protein
MLTIVQLVPHRATTFVPILLLPVIVYFFWKTSRDSLVAKVAVLQLSSLLVIANFGFFWPPLVSLVLIALAQTRSRRARIAAEAVGAVILIGFSYLAVADWTTFQPWLAPGFRPGPSWHEGSFGSALQFATIAALIWFVLEWTAKLRLATTQTPRLTAISAALFMAAMAPAAVYHERGKSMESDFFSRAGETLDLLDAQRWAAEHSENDAVFIVDNFPFRSMAERATIHMEPSFGYLYTRSMKSFEFDRRVIEFFGLTEIWDSSADLQDVLLIFNERKKAMTGSDIVRFAKTFGGTYYVQNNRKPPIMNLEIAHSNSSFTIYRIP